jgi:hypothetical protein
MMDWLTQYYKILNAIGITVLVISALAPIVKKMLKGDEEEDTE